MNDYLWSEFCFTFFEHEQDFISFGVMVVEWRRKKLVSSAEDHFVKTAEVMAFFTLMEQPGETDMFLIHTWGKTIYKTY